MGDHQTWTWDSSGKRICTSVTTKNMDNKEFYYCLYCNYKNSGKRQVQLREFYYGDNGSDNTDYRYKFDYNGHMIVGPQLDSKGKIKVFSYKLDNGDNSLIYMRSPKYDYHTGSVKSQHPVSGTISFEIAPMVDLDDAGLYPFLDSPDQVINGNRKGPIYLDGFYEDSDDNHYNSLDLSNHNRKCLSLEPYMKNGVPKYWHYNSNPILENCNINAISSDDGGFYQSWIYNSTEGTICTDHRTQNMKNKEFRYCLYANYKNKGKRQVKLKELYDNELDDISYGFTYDYVENQIVAREVEPKEVMTFSG